MRGADEYRMMGDSLAKAAGRFLTPGRFVNLIRPSD